MKMHISILLLGSLVISCQTMDLTTLKMNCKEMDWYEIGRADAVQGLPSQNYKKKSEPCKRFEDPQKAQYLSGWNAGLDSFCTHKQGFVLGRQGRHYEKICPDNKEKPFLNGYDKGMKVFNYEKNNKNLAEELQKTSQLVETTPESSHPLLYKKINRLETQLELNRALIAEIQEEVDENTRAPSQTF